MVAFQIGHPVYIDSLAEKFAAPLLPNSDTDLIKCFLPGREEAELSQKCALFCGLVKQEALVRLKGYLQQCAALQDELQRKADLDIRSNSSGQREFMALCGVLPANRERSDAADPFDSACLLVRQSSVICLSHCPVPSRAGLERASS